MGFGPFGEEGLYCGDCMRFDCMPIAISDENDPLTGKCPYRGKKVSALEAPCERMVPYRTVLSLAGGKDAVARMTQEEAQACVQRAKELLKTPEHLASLHPEEVSQMLCAGLFFRDRLAKMREARAKGNASHRDDYGEER
ncbi:MAG: hypothetical protein GXP25_05415 [Planctomycetes bacterium]|nr:hypothetical protein [Planctomycetota bacterium]